MTDFTNTSPPTLTGNRVVGGTLTANPGVWSPTPSGYSYAWERADDASGTNRQTITGATGSTYTIDPIDTNKQLRVGVYPVAPTVPSGGTVYANHNPNVSTDMTVGLIPWWYIQTGTPASTTTNYDIGVNHDANKPEVPATGITVAGGYPSNVTTAVDPLDAGNRVYLLETTTNAKYTSGNNSVFDRCDLWQPNGVRRQDNTVMFREGEETWEHFKILLGANWDFAATASGGWTNCYQHHTDGSYGSNVASGNALNLRNTNPGEWWFNIVGGPTGTGNIYDGSSAAGMTTLRVATAVQKVRWYDIKLHIVWSTTAALGFAQYYLDDVLLTNTNTDVKQVNPLTSWNSTRQGWVGPTLVISGSHVDQPNYEYSNYHTHITTDAALYYSRLMIGQSSSAVAF